MAKEKSGLHKEISSIFSGVPIPKKDSDQQQSPPATQEPETYGPPSHLSKGIAESSPVLKSLRKESPAETETPQPKAEEKPPAEQAPAAPAPVIKIKKSRSSWLENGLQAIKEKLFAPKPGVNPARQKATVILVPIMFIGMVVAFYKVLGGGMGGTTEINEIKPSNAIAASAVTIDWQIPEVYPATLRDPMQFKAPPPPPDTNDTQTVTKTQEIDIKGIIYSEDNPSAIIGTEIVYEGDTVSGAKVVKINKNSVEFEMNGKTWTQKVK
jgi:hypothetical protein